MNRHATLAVAIAILAGMAIGAASTLSPSEASQPYAGSSPYFPDQFVNQAKAIEPMPDTYGNYSNLGLPDTFPVETVDSEAIVDSTPEMYS